MCGRITILTLEELRDVIDDIEKRRQADRRSGACALRDVEQPRAQARPGNTIFAIGKAEKTSRLEPIELTWGIEAPWLASRKGADPGGGKPKLVFNTRLESALAGSALWADPIREGRCVLPAASFFEPHATETVTSPKTGKPIKRAYEFSMTSGEALLLASVRSDRRLSVVTTEPNPDVRAIHLRMPLALRFEEVPLWLEGDLSDIAQLADRTAVRFDVHPEKHLSSTSSAHRAAEQLSLF